MPFFKCKTWFFLGFGYTIMIVKKEKRKNTKTQKQNKTKTKIEISCRLKINLTFVNSMNTTKKEKKIIMENKNKILPKPGINQHSLQHFLNQGPLDLQSNALPTELFRQMTDFHLLQFVNIILILCSPSLTKLTLTNVFQSLAQCKIG